MSRGWKGVEDQAAPQVLYLPEGFDECSFTAPLGWG